jgi:hypothetical protein
MGKMEDDHRNRHELIIAEHGKALACIRGVDKLADMLVMATDRPATLTGMAMVFAELLGHNLPVCDHTSREASEVLVRAMYASMARTTLEHMDGKCSNKSLDEMLLEFMLDWARARKHAACEPCREMWRREDAARAPRKSTEENP